MKKWMKERIERLCPLYIQMLKRIRRLERKGYEIQMLYISSELLDQIFTANTIRTDSKLKPVFEWNEAGKHDLREPMGHIKGLPIEKSYKSGFKIKYSESPE